MVWEDFYEKDLSILLKEEMVINHADKYLGEVHSKQRQMYKGGPHVNIY